MMAPGEHHKSWKQLVGTWETHQKLWQGPEAPPMETKGTARFRLIMGGRYLVQTYNSEIPGMGKYTGRGTTAFDNLKQEFVHTWIDSMATGVMVSTGKPGKDKNVMELVGPATDPFTKEEFEMRTVSTIIDKDTVKFEMFEQRKGQEANRIMEIVYKRAKGGGKDKPARKKNTKDAKE